MSNRAIGNSFEQELCEKLYAHGFWAHNMAQNKSGQPADVIAVRNKVAYLIDCKVCSSDKFELRRMEENQELSMDLWLSCGNGQGWFAIKIEDEIYMLPVIVLKAYRSEKASLSYDDIRILAKPLNKWVARCK